MELFTESGFFTNSDVLMLNIMPRMLYEVDFLGASSSLMYAGSAIFHHDATCDSVGQGLIPMTMHPNC